MYERLEADIKAALLAGDKERAHALQFLKSALDAACKDQGVNLGDDTNIIAVLRKEAKKRLEAADLFEKGGNLEAAKKERSEEAIIASYLPPQLSEDTIREALETIIERNGLEKNMSSMGTLIGAAKKELGNGADPSVIARVATSILKD